MTEKQRHEITRLRREGFGYTAVAKQLGISKDTVKSFCRRNGLSGELEPVQGACRECGQPLPRAERMKPRVFCCETCRIKWWREHPDRIRQRAVYSFTCACCGKPFTAYGNAHRKYCSHECYIKARFKGGDGHE